MNKALASVALVATLIALAGCVQRPPTPTAIPTPNAASTSVNNSAPAPNSTALPRTTSTAQSGPTQVSSSATEIPILEEDCMAACHIPEASEFYDAGAVAQPADHAGRTTCLECHAKPDVKPLPETHLGRLDPSCATCHR